MFVFSETWFESSIILETKGFVSTFIHKIVCNSIVKRFYFEANQPTNFGFENKN